MPIIRSSKSVLIPIDNRSLVFLGYQFNKIEFHGINEVPLYNFWQEVMNVVNIASIYLNAPNPILIVGILINQNENLKELISKLETKMENISLNLPKDINYEKISGYEIPLLENPTSEILNPKKIRFNEYLFLNNLKIRNSAITMLDILLEKKTNSLILASENLQGKKTNKVTIKISHLNQSLIQNQTIEIKNLLSQIPNISGELIRPNNSYLRSNPIKIQLGIHKYSILEENFRTIINAIPKILPIEKLLFQPSPHRFIKYSKLSDIDNCDVKTDPSENYNKIRITISNFGWKINNIISLEYNSYRLIIEVNSFKFEIIYLGELVDDLNLTQDLISDIDNFFVIIYENELLSQILSDLDCDKMHINEFININQDLLFSH